MKLQAHADAELTQALLEKLGGLLMDKRKDLEERVVILERRMSIKDDCSLADAADAASLQENRLRARSMVEQHQQIINEIDAALLRLEVGSYGVSEISGEPIGHDRLLLIPWARIRIDDKD